MKTLSSTHTSLFSKSVRTISLFVILSAFLNTTFAQSPTCDIAAINAAFTGGGYIPLAVSGQPCSLYFINPNSQEAAQAQAAAAALGANLVWMNDAAENANVTAAINASPYSGSTIWIGVQRTGAGAAEFFASDGTTGPFLPSNGNPSIYQNWAGGEPNNSGYNDCTFGCNGPFCSDQYECQNGEQCVQIYPGGQWNDLQCNESSISVIEVNLCPEITIDVSANNFCAGNSTTLTASALLGSAPYQFAWSQTGPFTASNTVSPMSNTTYSVGVADRYSCTAADSVAITVFPGPDATFDVSSSVCIGSPVTVTYTGAASAGATYTWNFGTGIVVSGSGQGPYQVGWATSGPQTVTLQVTENGCTSTVESQNVSVLASPTADFTFTTVCEGNPTDLTNTSLANGSVILGSVWVVEGDTIISTDLSHTFSTSGTFPVQLGVLTIDSCYATVTQQVTVLSGPTAVLNHTDATCFGNCDGTAEAVVQGGTAPINVNWSTGDVGNSISNLCAGPVTVTVSDAGGCSFNGQVDVLEPTELTVTVIVTETSCPGLPNGTATDNPSGGTPPYTTTWAGLNPNALPAGNYDVTVTDGNGCVVVEPYTIIDGAGLTLDFTIVDNICFGGTNGSATLNVSNGVAPYDIGWTDAFANPIQINAGSQGVESITDLGAGTYNVGVQDATGCAALASITITQPAIDLVMNLTPQDLSCFESADGAIGVNQNGLSPYVFNLTDVFGTPVSSGTSPSNYTFQGLDIGIYFIEAIDANGCSTNNAVELFQPEPLAIESLVTPISCYQGSDGAIAVTQTTGGTTPYATITWDDPSNQVGSTATDLSQGTYTATISDANGCEIEQAFILSEPSKMNLEGRYLTDTCGQGKGAAIVDVTLGTPSYSYLWKPDSVSTGVHYNLEAGSYEVVVTDANGCKDSTFVDVADDLPYPFAAFDYRIEGENLLDQEVQFINNSIGTSQWVWNFGEGSSSNEENPRFHYDRAGDYLVQLLGSNGYCYDTTYKYVNIDPLLLVYVPNAFTPGNNDLNNTFYPQGEGIEEASYDMFIYDRWGKLIWQTGNFSKQWDGTNMYTQKEVPVGTYVYLIKFREFADLDRHIYKGRVHLVRD